VRQQKDTQRSTVSIGFDGRVHKTFRGPKAEERFATEVKVLRYLEQRGCPFVPRLLDSDPETLKIITSNCGAIVEQLSERKTKSLFEELETFGVRHDDPFMRNVTYRATDGRFCVIDFEFATILDEVVEGDAASEPGVQAADTIGAGTDDAEAAAGPGMDWSCHTDVGRYRKNNEDVYVALSLDDEGARYLGSEGAASLADSDLIFAVSDGMGGARSGEFASRIAIEKITQLLPRHFRRQDGVPSGDTEVLTDLFRFIHIEMKLMSESYPECEGMGATLSLAWMTPDRMLVAHIGDTRIYRWRDGEGDGGGFTQLTKDDTRVGAMMRAGQLSEYQARNHPARNMLSKALGGGNQYVDPQVEVVPIEAGDRFLICSDGVTDGIWNRALGELLQTGATAGEVVAKAVTVSGKDNATSIVLRAL
jgi:serine/threonine protein phosphatase PrpC